MRTITLTSPAPRRRISSCCFISLSGLTEFKKFDDFSVESEVFRLFGFPSNNWDAIEICLFSSNYAISCDFILGDFSSSIILLLVVLFKSASSSDEPFYKLLENIKPSWSSSWLSSFSPIVIIIFGLSLLLLSLLRLSLP